MKTLNVETVEHAQNVNKIIKDNNDVFLFVYMEGCGPCNATKPEWDKFTDAFKSRYPNKSSLHLIKINKNYVDGLNIGAIDGFPTLKYIKGDTIENYEDSSISVKDRSADSFVNWGDSKITEVVSIMPTDSLNLYKRLKRNTSNKSHSKSNKSSNKRSKSNKSSKSNKRSKSNKSKSNKRSKSNKCNK